MEPSPGGLAPFVLFMSFLTAVFALSIIANVADLHDRFDRVEGFAPDWLLFDKLGLAFQCLSTLLMLAIWGGGLGIFWFEALRGIYPNEVSRLALAGVYYFLVGIAFAMTLRRAAVLAIRFVQERPQEVLRSVVAVAVAGALGLAIMAAVAHFAFGRSPAEVLAGAREYFASLQPDAGGR